MPNKLTILSLPIHPFILAACLVLASLLAVSTTVLPEEALQTLVIFEALAAFGFLLALVIIRDAQKAALVVSICLGFFGCFAAFENICTISFTGLTGQAVPDWLVLACFLALTAAVVIAVLQDRWQIGQSTITFNHQTAGNALNIVALVMLVLNLLPLIIFEQQLSSKSRTAISDFSKLTNDLKVADTTKKPDIYYILLDAYANPNTLKQLWGYDDHEFFDFLKDRGFYVVPKAASNYDRTTLSMASSLNMQYVGDIRQSIGENSEFTNTYLRLRQDNCVARLLKQLGYNCVTVNADGVIEGNNWTFPNLKINVFTTAVLFLTPLRTTEKYFPLLRNLFTDMRLHASQRIEDIVALPGPKFVYIHSELSHAPYVFDQNGNTLPLSRNLLHEYGSPSLYIAQLKFAQKEAVRWITLMLDKPGPKPIIIIQSDHGPEFKTDDYFNERMRILNAYYLPEVANKGLFESITPVNSFRVLFNDYFGTSLPILPDRSYCVRAPELSDKWLDVTDKLKF